MVSPQSLLLLLLPAVAAAQLSCVGVISTGFDDWCNANCNHPKPFCPAQFCQCTSETSPTPSPSPQSGDLCISQSIFLSDSWCTTMCNFNPPFCPVGWCSCVDEEPEDLILINQHFPSCCDVDIEMFYIENSNVYNQRLDGQTKLPIGEPILCGQFLGPTDIEIDNDLNVYVADPVAATVTRILPGCTGTSIVSSWTAGSVIDAPTAITVADGGLYVAGKDRVHFILLDESYTIGSITTTPMTIRQVEALDEAPDGTIFFVEQGARIMKYDPGTGTVSVYFDVNELRIPDIKDVKVTDCGVVFSVTDANTIWLCPDINNSSSCGVYCHQDMENLDSSSCEYMNNPFGLTVDCNCTIYSAQRGNGNLIAHSYNGAYNYQNTTVLESSLYHAIDVEIYVSNECSPSSTNTASRSSSVSPSDSRTSSLTASPTVSSSRSSTSSPSASPSSTASPSSSSSSSPSPSSSLSASPTSSATASLSASPTSSLSASPTATSSLSASPTATSSLSASPSASLTASITPSITPSPSALFSLAVGIDDYNTECAVGECGYDTNIALNEAETSRKFGVFVYITDVRASTEDTSDCFSTDLFQTTPVLLISCQRLVDPSTYVEPFDAEYSAAFRVYIRTTSTGVSSSGLPPTYRTPVGVFAPSTFPNASPNTILAGQLECIGFEGQRARLVWHEPRPCWNDAKFPSANTCTPTRSTPVSDASSYVNTTAGGASMTQPGLYPFHEVFCPLD